ncbi:hypothetical protein [Alicycliphilus denitrificans]|uniref:hypothetical protein n=1 Tax=Alicycliphilus denitrificans TaxID=179636 RepID=UPI0001DA0DF5|nr:hypothetical protein [Alicycliphilus denitrificans]ADV01297.1 hypothetical protein Alide_3580 [Alicycliphilus denitrificans BC]
MQHIGTLFLAKARPVVDVGPDGEFRLTLALIDNLGGGQKEGYRVRWTGPDARAFWDAQQRNLLPGAVLRAELTHLRQHMGNAYPHVPELRARVVRLEVVPKASACAAPQPSNQEHHAAA